MDVRQAKANYLKELKWHYDNGLLRHNTHLEIADKASYKDKVFIATFSSEVESLAKRLSYFADNQLLDANQGYNDDYNANSPMVDQLKKHTEMLLQEYEKNPHGFLAERRLQKYAALRTITELYDKQQLTNERIVQIEKDYPKMYDSFFSSTTKNLVDSVRKEIKPSIIMELNN